MPAFLAKLRSFAQTRNGKIALGSTAVGGVVAAGLLTRKRAGGDPKAPAAADATTANPTPSFIPNTGSGGAVNGGDAVNEPTPSPNIDAGALEDLLALLARTNDNVEAIINRPAPDPTPAPTPVPTYNPPPAPAPVAQPAPPPPAPAPAPQRTYTVVKGDNLSKIAQRFYGRQDWQKIYNANRGVIGGNPNKIYPGQVLVIP
jgi:nucleoid-associated protein YgaU